MINIFNKKTRRYCMSRTNGEILEFLIQNQIRRENIRKTKNRVISVTTKKTNSVKFTPFDNNSENIISRKVSGDTIIFFRDIL